MLGLDGLCFICSLICGLYLLVKMAGTCVLKFLDDEFVFFFCFF